MKKKLWIPILILVVFGAVLFFLFRSAPGTDAPTREKAMAKSGVVYRSLRFVLPAEDGVPFGQQTDDGRWRVAIRNGRSVRALTDDVFDEIRVFSVFFIDRYSNLQYVAAVCRDGKWGYLRFPASDLTRASSDALPWLIEPVYDNAEPFCNGVAAVCLNGKYGLVNLSGEWLIEPEYEDVRYYSESLIPVKQNGSWCYITSRGAKVYGPFEGAESFSEGFAAVCQNGKWGYIDRNGAPVTEFLYDDAWEVSDGRAEVLADGEWTVISLPET